MLASHEASSQEVFEDSMDHHDTIETIAKAYLTNRECFFQEAVYHILPELKLRRIIPAVYFVNNSLPEERIRVLLPEKELSKLPGNRPNIFKRSKIDRYM